MKYLLRVAQVSKDLPLEGRETHMSKDTYYPPVKAQPKQTVEVAKGDKKLKVNKSDVDAYLRRGFKIVGADDQKDRAKEEAAKAEEARIQAEEAKAKADAEKAEAEAKAAEAKAQADKAAEEAAAAEAAAETEDAAETEGADEEKKPSGRRRRGSN